MESKNILKRFFKFALNADDMDTKVFAFFPDNKIMLNKLIILLI